MFFGESHEAHETSVEEKNLEIDDALKVFGENWNPIYMPFIRLQYLQRPRAFKNIECFFLHKILTKLACKIRRNRRNHEGDWDAPLRLSLMRLLLLQSKYFNDTRTHKLL